MGRRRRRPQRSWRLAVAAGLLLLVLSVQFLWLLSGGLRDAQDANGDGQDGESSDANQHASPASTAPREDDLDESIGEDTEDDGDGEKFESDGAEQGEEEVLELRDVFGDAGPARVPEVWVPRVEEGEWKATVDAMIKDLRESPGASDDAEPPVHEVDLTSLEADVAKTIDAFRKHRASLIGELVVDHFTNVFGSIVSSEGDHTSEFVSSIDDIDDPRVAFEEGEDASQVSTAQCDAWQTKLQGSFREEIVFSIADSVPPSHKVLWHQVLEDRLELEDANAKSLDAQRARLLVLPWTQDASLLAIRSPATNQLTYRVLFSRLMNGQLNTLSLNTRRQDLIEVMTSYMNGKRCSYGSLEVQPPSFRVSTHVEECQALFENHSDAEEADTPWLLEEFGAISCPNAGQPGNCLEVPANSVVLRGIGALRNQFGQCQARPGGQQVLVQRAMLDPLLIHSRRFKLHALILVAKTDPWLVYWSRGFISLAAENARTDEMGSYARSTVIDASSFDRESTQTSKQQPGNEPSVWNHERFSRFLSTYGHCKQGRCDKLWLRVERICRLLVEASLEAGRGQTDAPGAGAFQVFRASFWVDEGLVPYLHRASADVSMWLDDHGPGSDTFRDRAKALLAEAVQLVTQVGVEPRRWSVLLDENHEKCVLKARTFDPCLQIPKPHATPGEAHSVSSFSTGKNVDGGSHGNGQAKDAPDGRDDDREDEADNDEDDEEEGENIEKGMGFGLSEAVQGGAATMHVLSSSSELFSPKSPLDVQRRKAHIALDSP